MAQETSSVKKSKGRYVQGGQTEEYKTRLGWWERRPMEHSSDDIVYVIEKHVERRPDLIAYNFYNDVRLMWMVLQYNHIVDVETELVEGVEIRLPTETRVSSSVLTKTTSGSVT